LFSTLNKASKTGKNKLNLALARSDLKDQSNLSFNKFILTPFILLINTFASFLLPNELNNYSFSSTLNNQLAGSNAWLVMMLRWGFYCLVVY
jgi:hypothetical protein